MREVAKVEGVGGKRCSVNGECLARRGIESDLDSQRRERTCSFKDKSGWESQAQRLRATDSGAFGCTAASSVGHFWREQQHSLPASRAPADRPAQSDYRYELNAGEEDERFTSLKDKAEKE